MASYIEQRDDYRIARDDDGYGNALILKTSWSGGYLNLVAKHKIRVITLNEFDWPDADISFLLGIPGIHGVNVISD